MMTLTRQAQATVTFIDDYCRHYQECFPDVRSFEQFTYLHVGMLSEIKRKTLPAIAKAVGTTDAQALHHFLANAPWSVAAVRERRLHLIHQALHERPFTLCIDETGDEKKGQSTDYVAHQYIGNLGKLANGAVSVNDYGMLENITFPLIFSIYKPRTRLHADDAYTTKPALAVKIIEELQRQDFHFSIVLADSLYGESSDFISALERMHLGKMAETDLLAIVQGLRGLLIAQGFVTESDFTATLTALQREVNEQICLFPFYVAYGQRMA